MESYAGPVTGEEVVRTVFALELYCANKDTGNNIVNYQKLTFTGCRGKSVVEWDIKEGEFSAPKYTIESMPRGGRIPHDHGSGGRAAGGTGIAVSNRQPGRTAAVRVLPNSLESEGKLHNERAERREL